MSGSSRLLSEVESASIAGVSIETIRQFRGCGLLDPVKEDGVERFREIDIKTLFYSRTKSNDVASSTDSAVDIAAHEAAKPQRNGAGTLSAPPAPAPLDSASTQALQSGPAVQSISSSQTSPVADSTQVKSVVPSETGSPNPETGASPTELKSETATDSESEKLLPVPSSLSADYMVEINKGLREQLEILREERDWLRARVEKLETRSEREQMLLLSESENIRKLIQQGEQQRRPTWLRGLPWFNNSRS